MAQYSFYAFDGAAVTNMGQFIAASDRAAFNIARYKSGRNRVEVWVDGRRLASSERSSLNALNV